MTRRWLPGLLACALTFALLLSGCGRAAASDETVDDPHATAAVENSESETGDAEMKAADPLKVVCTIFPPYDFVREIAGDAVELTMLLRPGAESHSYDPTPQDIITIGDCDLFLYVGGENDLWVERILESIDTPVRAVALTDLVETVEEELVEGMEGGRSHNHDDQDQEHDDHEDDHDHEEEERELDEHVWTAPENAALITQALTETLCGLDPDNEELFRQRSAAYVAQLRELDEDFREMVTGARRHTVIFGDRFPFRYLADAYGLEYYAAFPGCSTETEASSATVAFLIEKVRDEEIPVVFYIELSNQKMADTIIETTGAVKRQLHSVHNLSRDDFEAGEGYLSLMRQNLENLREALY